MIIAVGFKENNERAVQFRKWETQLLRTLLSKGGDCYTEDLYYQVLEMGDSPFGFIDLSKADIGKSYE